MKAIKLVYEITSNNTSQNEFNLEVTEKNNKLPDIYWTSKLHKNAIKVRFVINAHMCSVN